MAEDTKTPKIIEETVSLDIKKNHVGIFIGPNGKNLKKFIIFETKSRIVAKFDDIEKIDDIKGLFCLIETNDDNDDVIAHLKCSDEKFMEIMKECIFEHQKSILEKTKKNNDMSKYVFKTTMDHMMIPKYIGRGGYNIHQIRDEIQEKDPETSKIRISICEDKKIRMNRLRFDVIKTEFESEQNVLITVTMITKNRENTFHIIKDILTKSINVVNDTNHSNKNNENNENNDWGDISTDDVSGW